jgi:hypothetical protein
MVIGDPLLVTVPATCRERSPLAASVAAVRMSLGDFAATPLSELLDALDVLDVLDVLDELDELPPHAESAHAQMTATVDRAIRRRTGKASVVVRAASVAGAAPADASMVSDGAPSAVG